VGLIAMFRIITAQKKLIERLQAGEDKGTS
jgi:hypothetical protein